MPGAILDASAVLAVLFDEPGREAVEAVIVDAMISSVNLAEVVGKLIDSGRGFDEIVRRLETLNIPVAPFDASLALAAGRLRAATRAQGLALADRACLALAERERLPAWTADRRWAALGDIGIDVRVVR